MNVDEVEHVIRSMAEKIMKEIISFKEVGPKSPHGIYLYSVKRNEWVLIERDGERFKPFSDGYYVLYFDNTKCPACRKYDKIWFPFVKQHAPKLRNYFFVIILCEWFAHACKSKAASESFRHYDVHASPTTILLHVKDGEVAYDEKYEGVLHEKEIGEVILKFPERAERAERGEKVELPRRKSLEEELILALLKKLLSSSGGGKGD